MDLNRGEPASSVTKRQGSDGCRIYCCSFCYRFEVPSYESWLWHLGSREHQLSITKSRSWSHWRRDEFRNRSVTVFGVLGLTSREILEYLGHWGEVEDFDYPFMKDGENGLTDHCLCLFRDSEAADACVRNENHEFKGKKLSVLSRRDRPPPTRSSTERKERDKRRRNRDNSGAGWDWKRRRVDEKDDAEGRTGKEDKDKNKK
ncbi:unnamed protein product [Orchesella dallaii]|uniref:RRM domain-containing protein n=1 Tax=Orchesella dallaii TaxID=48710 RepID=A0ABP1QX47_9HEXA